VHTIQFQYLHLCDRPEINVKPWDALIEDLKDGNSRVTWLDREPYAYWKGNPSVSVTRQELVKCNVSSTQDWNARIYNQVARLLILRTMRLAVLGKSIATPFLAHKHVINTISYWGQILKKFLTFVFIHWNTGLVQRGQGRV
jgi:hypothetical protein